MAGYSAQPFNAGEHPRATGGRFQATGAAQAAAARRPSGTWAGGPVRRGVGRKGAPDTRVVAAQRKLNALGITDERGRPLLVDGIDGAHTTAAIKKWQQANGLKPTGELDAASMAKLLASKPKPTARSRMTRPAKRTTRPSTSSTKPAKPKQPPAYVDRGPGFSRFGNSAST